MERKIGEIFEFGGEWYQCVVAIQGCRECSFRTKDFCTRHSECMSTERSDNTSVIFKKLEKVGEPIIYMSRTFQKLKSSDAEQCKYCYFGNQVCNPQLCGKESFLVEIKQNKEDMEQEIEYFGDENTKHSNSEKIGKNLKEFNLEAAKSGKPVCTRDGRKARIICFDSKNDPQRPIIALVENNSNELLYEYTIKGKELFSHISTTGTSDLMMLPEKKEGWINIYNADTTFYYVDGRVFETKDEAVQEAKEEVEKEQREKNEYIDTIRVEWEE